VATYTGICTQGLVALIGKWDYSLIENAATYALDQNIQVNPKNFKQLLHNLVDQNEKDQLTLPMSEQTLEFVRTMGYFIHDQS
jgi:hypothetical protein